MITSLIAAAWKKVGLNIVTDDNLDHRSCSKLNIHKCLLTSACQFDVWFEKAPPNTITWFWWKGNIEWNFLGLGNSIEEKKLKIIILSF